MSDSPKLRFRSYGVNGPTIILIHGGPGAPGNLAPIGRYFADDFRLFEPFQRSSSDLPLTVDRHISDLHDFIRQHCPNEKPHLLGHSWGAMLTLAYAAEYCECVDSLILVGCGTFDSRHRKILKQTIQQRITPEIRAQLESIGNDIPNPDERLAAMGKIIQPIYYYSLLPEEPDDEITPDARAHHQTWDDMINQQKQRRYPATFANIKNPVLMLHGDFDPHPGVQIRDQLIEYMPQLEYVEFANCGHYPWQESQTQDKFYQTVLRRLKQ